MQRTLLFALLLLICPWASTLAQTMYYPDNTVKVYAYGYEQTMAWCSGFNNPQFTMGDLNNDGKPDLVVFEAGLGVKTFINMGSVSSPDYRYEPDFALNFPPLFNYLILADYNCDGIPDLFHRGLDGFSVYKGYYNSRNQLCFTYYQDLFYTNDASAGGAANAYDNPGGDIPAIVDVDGDGDLDFISYDINGGNMNFYKNMRVEMGLPCDSIHVELKDRCWGKVYQGYWRTHVLPYECDNSGLLRETGDTANKKTHSGNTACLFDWDMDGDYDYLDGNVSFNEMTFLKNGKHEYGTSIDTMISQDTVWQSGGKQIELLSWPAAFNIDIDGDGKKDLVISPTTRNASENYKCVWWYKNNTTPGSPNWQFQSDSLFVDKTIEAGSGTHPVLFDYNKDGKPDLFVGSDGYRQANGSLRSKISLYLNTSTAGSPSLTFQTRDFLGIDSFGFAGAAPAFGDIDGDSISDMILGHSDGTLSYFKNMASSDTVQPIWHLQQLTLTDMGGATINVDGNAAPFIYDIDKDGKPDLVIGNIYGTIRYYRNMSTTPGTISLKLVNNALGHVKVDAAHSLGCYSTPFIGRIDSSGRDYLVLGSNSGNIYEYDSVASGDTTLTYPLLTSQYSWIDSTFLNYNHPGTAIGVYDNLESTVTVGDIAGDGSLYMIVGSVKGGLELYRRKTKDDMSVPVVTESGSLQVFPNPAGDVLNVSWNGILQSEVRLSILDIEGRTLSAAVYPTAQHSAVVNTAALAPGTYFCLVYSGSRKYYSKFSVIR